MAGDVVERNRKSEKRPSRRSRRRLSIRIDMTPMVDIAFLLLIFYMVTTVFAMPQAIEINLPPADPDPVVVRASNLLTVRVDAGGRFWWNVGLEGEENLPQLLPGSLSVADSNSYDVDTDSLRALLVEKNRANPRLNTLILIHRDGAYEYMVTILDEIDLFERARNDAIAARLGIPVEELPEDRRFSYRYAIGEWVDRDSRLVARALGGGRRGVERYCFAGRCWSGPTPRRAAGLWP